MERETIDVSDSDEEEEVIANKNPKISETKLWIQNEKLSTKSKIDELKSKVLNLRKRQKGNDEHESDAQSQDEGSPAKKSRQTECSDSTSESDVAIIEDFNGSSGSKKPLSLPSFKPMAEVSFDTVIKFSQPSLLESKYIDDRTSSEITCTEVNKSSNDDASKKEKTRISEADVVQPALTYKGKRDEPTRSRSQISSQAQYRERSREPPRNSDEPQPLVKVIFRDEELARMFRKAVHEALVEVLAVEDPEIDESENFPGVELNIWDSEIPEESQNLAEPSSLFKLDTAPVKAAFKRHMPKYKQAFSSVLEGKQKEEEEVKKVGGAGSNVPNTCFNCEGNHMLTECPKPINEESVFKNRQKHNSMRRSQPKTSRYHIDEEQRFAHLVPGRISDNLRNALGLHPNQLPRYVYRMRIMGYPPGWLEEAKITHSGIALIDESKTGTNGGEIKTDVSGSKDTYDISKIIEYPGFNVPVPQDHNMMDESRRHQCPPLAWNQSKEYMIEEIGSSAAKGYKKKKLKRDSMPNDEVLITRDDMEVVEIDDEVMIVLDSTADSELQDDVQQAMKDDDSISPPGIDTSILSQDSSSMPPSPSLAILMAQKQSILSELEGSSSKSQPATPGSPKHVSSTSNSVVCTPEPTLGRTKSLSMGTPVLESHSPFSSLPCADKFSQGISDHLNFENLPDATGKFEKMKTIINKVRNIVDNLHEDEDGS